MSSAFRAVDLRTGDLVMNGSHAILCVDCDKVRVIFLGASEYFVMLHQELDSYLELYSFLRHEFSERVA